MFYLLSYLLVLLKMTRVVQSRCSLSFPECATLFLCTSWKWVHTSVTCSLTSWQVASNHETPRLTTGRRSRAIDHVSVTTTSKYTGTVNWSTFLKHLRSLSLMSFSTLFRFINFRLIIQ